MRDSNKSQSRFEISIKSALNGFSSASCWDRVLFTSPRVQYTKMVFLLQIVRIECYLHHPVCIY